MNILCKVPDEVTITRESFKELLKRNALARRFGFSKKHTAEIMKMREINKSSSYPDKLYNLPVLWNTEYTYLAS